MSSILAPSVPRLGVIFMFGRPSFKIPALKVQTCRLPGISGRLGPMKRPESGDSLFQFAKRAAPIPATGGKNDGHAG
jgi:hypothetical protein